MTPLPLLRKLTPFVLFAVIGGCRGDSGPPTTTTLSSPSGATFSEENFSGDNGDVGRGKPKAEDILASAVFTHVKGRYRECTGADGNPYVETDVTFTGASEGDSRLTGAIEIRVQDLYDNIKIVGPSLGKMFIRDKNGREKFRGEYDAWGTAGADYVQGTVVGGFRGEKGRVVAGWTVIFRDNGVFGEFGGPPRDQRIPAGIYSGKCPSGTVWTNTENDLPFTAVAAAVSAAGIKGRIPGR